MAPAKTAAVRLSARRIDAYVKAHFEGSARRAARALACDHVTLWRAMNALSKRGASVTLLRALAAHSGESMGYWSGETT